MGATRRESHPCLFQNPSPGEYRVTPPSILSAIGKTPIVELKRLAPKGTRILVKLEYYNPTGSYKDRMALSMIERAERRLDLKPGMTVVEYTGGSTGISVAFVCAVKGYACRIVTNDAVAPEKRRAMEIFGAKLEVLESEGGKLTPDLVPRMMARAKEIAAEIPSFRTDQMRNPDMVAGYEPLGREVVHQAEGHVDIFCASVGTAGMIVGAGRALKGVVPMAEVVGFEPATSAVLSGAEPGTHGVEGVAPGFVPPQFDRAIVTRIMSVDEGEGRRMAWELARQEGIFAGTSTGLNVAGAIALAKEAGAGKTVVTVAVDSGFKYMAGDLYSTAESARATREAPVR